MKCPFVTNPELIDRTFNKEINYKDLGGKEDYIFFDHEDIDGNIKRVQFCELMGRKTDVFECLNEIEWKNCSTYKTSNFGIKNKKKEVNEMDDWGIDELIKKGGVIIMEGGKEIDKLTPEQEDLINDCHEKRFIEEMEKEEKEHKTIPINPDRLDRILKRIGRKKLDNNEKYCDLKEIKEVKVNVKKETSEDGY